MLFTLLCQAYDTVTKEYTLNNGMKVIVRPIHKAPVVVSMIWYRVGSADERGGITGVSHVLEHMMFKGTEKYPQGVFSKQIANNGGQNNAFTNRDYTAYFQILRNDKLPLAFKLEADRMQNLLLDSSEFAKEIKVVQEERRMRTDDNPQALTIERFMATLHLSSPYHHPIIGWENDLKNMDIKDVQNWYQKWYAPNNATLVVVGDINPDNVYQLANKYFAPIKAHSLPQRKPQREPKPLGMKKVLVQTNSQLPMIVIGFNVPSLNTTPEPKDSYALEVLAGILGNGESARLTKDLIKEKRLASSIQADYDIYSRFDSEFVIYAIPTTKEKLSRLKNLIIDEINQLKSSSVSSEELTKVKNQVIAGKVYQKDSLFGQALELGLLENNHIGWKESENYVNKIKDVTSQDIQAAARKYLTDKNITIAILEPI